MGCVSSKSAVESGSLAEKGTYCGSSARTSKDVGQTTSRGPSGVLPKGATSGASTPKPKGAVAAIKHMEWDSHRLLAADSAAWPSPFGDCSLLAALSTGAAGLQVSPEKLGAALPFPGPEAAYLVGVLQETADAALANRANLAALCDRAGVFLEVLAAYAPEMGAARFRRAVDEAKDVLEAMLAYARHYASRNCLVPLLTSAGDRERFRALVLALRDLTARLQQAAPGAAEASGRMAEVAVAVMETAVDQYRDPSAPARELLSALGGPEAAVRDPQLLRRVLAGADVCGERVGMAAGPDAALETASALLASHLDPSLQRLIRQPELRLFWRRTFAGAAEVPWEAWWARFPAFLASLAVPAEEQAKLKCIIRDLDTSRGQIDFMRAVDCVQPGTVSVWELHRRFGPEPLLPQLLDILPGAKEYYAWSFVGIEVGVVTRTGPAKVSSQAAPLPRQAPLPPPSYVWRWNRPILPRAPAPQLLVLLGQEGAGKSCLAANCLQRSGGYWVDLRGVGSGAQVAARFCAALERPGPASAADVVAALSSRAAAHGPFSAAVDSAQDALSQPEAAEALRAVLRGVLREAPAVRLIVTSTVPLGLEEEAGGADDGAGSTPSSAVAVVELRPAPPRTAFDLVREFALTEAEVTAVAEACHHSPLALVLGAEGLTSGRLELTDLAELDSSPGAAEPSPPDRTRAVVRLSLARLPPDQLRAASQLAVLPTAFDDEAAAAVLGLSAGPCGAHGMLAALVRHHVLDVPYPHVYDMHSTVRQEALALCSAQALSEAEGRFVGHTLSRVGAWAAAHGRCGPGGAEGRVALVAARERLPHISQALRLLGQGGQAEGGSAEAAAGALSSGGPLEALAAAVTAGELCGFVESLGLLGEVRGACRALCDRLQRRDPGETELGGPLAAHASTPVAQASAQAPTAVGSCRTAGAVHSGGDQCSGIAMDGAMGAPGMAFVESMLAWIEGRNE
ncbi:hypothetical protein HYH03_017476 [Edaphochlamys debaryana]|uniref:Uncharacterized protein n=1 Tax=Edaphochlamys debaryana TaxID=47281 RepID=A0A836BQJ9_9CHLO|nr:hypothetical protein HYH03_017476 [Edaphochlamys debaryana]|eukprot:KAG2483673.1 hypothetical protein HYH03_017476 [Edaphochlamys debaryana]